MNKVVQDVIKNTLIMFAVGLALAAVAPLLAGGLGEMGAIGAEFAAKVVKEATMSEILWTGVFFGSFGGIHAAFGPAFNAVFGGEKEAAAPTPAKAKDTGPVVHLQLAPEQSKEVVAALSSKYRDQVAGEQSVTPSRHV